MNNMNITSLEKMEEIVKNNKTLSWDGWTVVAKKHSPSAWMRPNAVFVHGKWYQADRFEPGILGWKMPHSLVR